MLTASNYHAHVRVKLVFVSIKAPILVPSIWVSTVVMVANGLKSWNTSIRPIHASMSHACCILVSNIESL